MEDAGWGVELKFVVYKSNLKKSMAKNRCTLASEQTSPAYSEPHNSPTMLRSLLKPIPGLSGGILTDLEGFGWDLYRFVQGICNGPTRGQEGTQKSARIRVCRGLRDLEECEGFRALGLSGRFWGNAGFKNWGSGWGFRV